MVLCVCVCVCWGWVGVGGYSGMMFHVYKIMCLVTIFTLRLREAFE